MWEALERWFAGSFMPHGHCYLWSPAIVWLQVLANGFIGLAYVSISATLAIILRRIRDIPFSRMYVAFGVFIVTCGCTHFLDVVTIWHPVYWLDGAVRAMTAIASVGTAVMLVPLVPKAVGLARAAEVAHERGLRLESTYKELASAHEKTKELERMKTEFFANVSHELRTPLALVLGPTDKLLASDELTPPQRRDLETVARNARALLKHVNDLLDVARLDVGKLHASYARVDVAALIRRVASQFDALARDRAAELVVRAPATCGGELDPDKIERVLANLVGNAFKFSPQGGVVRVSLEPAGDQLRIEVADDGPGIPAEQRSVVFDRFAQGDASTTRRFGGTGLGLSIVRELVELHGGTVTVATAPEGGALFTVTLPAHAPAGMPVSSEPRMASADAAITIEVAHAQTKAAESDAKVGTPAVTPRDGRRPTILVAEDNAEMNAFITDALSVRYDVVRAHDGEQALALARASRPDLVLSDVMMPKRSGEELVAALRADPQLADVPVVVLTARTDDALRIRMLESGATDYIMKPFAAEELRARLANLVAMQRARDVLRSELASRQSDVEELVTELTRQKRELETAVENLRVARDQAEEASEKKTSFLAMVSHELRTPLTSVQLLVDRLASSREALPPAAEKSLGRMDRAVARLSTLVDSLLGYARMQSGRLSVHPVAFDPKATIADVVEELRPIAQNKGLELVVDEEPGDLTIESDPALVRLVVVNLAMNAVKFTAAGRVTLRLGRADADAADRDPAAVAPAGRATTPGVRIRVEDTGPGIAAAEQTRIFDPFHRLEAPRNAHVPGVGLGLSLVRDVVDALGGRVSVRSEPGHGATFEVVLPAAPPPPLGA